VIPLEPRPIHLGLFQCSAVPVEELEAAGRASCERKGCRLSWTEEQGCRVSCDVRAEHAREHTPRHPHLHPTCLRLKAMIFDKTQRRTFICWQKARSRLSPLLPRRQNPHSSNEPSAPLPRWKTDGNGADHDSTFPRSLTPHQCLTVAVIRQLRLQKTKHLLSLSQQTQLDHAGSIATSPAGRGGGPAVAAAEAAAAAA